MEASITSNREIFSPYAGLSRSLKFKKLDIPNLNSITPSAPLSITVCASLKSSVYVNFVGLSSDTYVCNPDQISAPCEFCTNHLVVEASQSVPAS